MGIINTYEINLTNSMDRTMTDEVKNENEEVAETEQKQPSYIEQIAAKMSRENAYNNFYKKQEVKEEDMPPFPSVPTYDAKAWKIMREQAKPGSLFWNVGK